MSKPQYPKPYQPNWRDKYEIDSIYTPPPHRYGYMIRVNHPEIIGHYKAYLKEIGAWNGDPISDEERFEFERRVLRGDYPEIKLKRA